MKQFQVQKDALSNVRNVDVESRALSDGETRIAVEKFGFSANNITYGVAGDTLGYWKFFPTSEGEPWGVIPVWGFGKVTETNCPDMPVGERLFGYFPPASEVIMTPGGIAPSHFFDQAAHRAELPKGYNIYRRVAAEPGYDPAQDRLRMLLYPLYITSFSLWDQLKVEDWYGAEQVVIVSASSKTSLGLAYALKDDDNAPSTVGLTSAQNLDFVTGLGIYDTVLSYDDLGAMPPVASVIVDMSGNADLLGALHVQFGDQMRQTLNVGLTHWEGARTNPSINRERSSFFFAPSRIQARMKDWGAEEFGRRSSDFVMGTAARSMDWLKLRDLGGLSGLEAEYPAVLNGQVPPDQGLFVML